MLTDYIEAAIRHARYKILAEDGTYYGEIDGCQGVWANETELEVCREVLREVLEEWILLHVRDGAELPIIDELDINLRRAA